MLVQTKISSIYAKSKFDRFKFILTSFETSFHKEFNSIFHEY